MIVGVGVDIVGIERFGRSLERTPALRDRLFASSELSRSDGTPRTAASLAARFAAKEALMKAVGDTIDFRWHDMVVHADDEGNPDFLLTGVVAATAERRGITSVHLSLSHDAGSAIAFVVAEGDPR
ncbi:holo-ACP synthase [Naasia lichenicola]|uniref:Holo-[acyl-carrier-protein] synthase n=1 Tax=Naasia lichenicola TaxID=2565933 RepID=A0A4S4FKP5_9MICO|nr:holo-ACP synthase [Naasia lichenicola]THG29746.1 holo-ACP synthase [Naasia lichenicola]